MGAFVVINVILSLVFASSASDKCATFETKKVEFLETIEKWKSVCTPLVDDIKLNIPSEEDIIAVSESVEKLKKLREDMEPVMAKLHRTNATIAINLSSCGKFSDHLMETYARYIVAYRPYCPEKFKELTKHIDPARAYFEKNEKLSLDILKARDANQNQINAFWEHSDFHLDRLQPKRRDTAEARGE